MENLYHNVYYQPGEEPVFCYRTGLTVYEESFTGGTLIARGWNAAGYPLNVLSNCATRINPALFQKPQAFHLELDGEYADWDLNFLDFACRKEDQKTHAVVALGCKDKSVKIYVHTLLDGSPVFSRWLEIENQGDNFIGISRLAVMSGGIEVLGLPGTALHWERIAGGKKPDEIYRLGYFDSHEWGREGDFSWHTLKADVISFDGRYNRERCRHPVFYLQNTIKGTTMVGQLAWSGGYRFSFDYNPCVYNGWTGLAMEAEIDSVKPLFVVAPGEKWQTPIMHIGMVSGDLDRAINAMHQHSRLSVLNLPAAKNQCRVGAGMGAEHDMNVDTTKQFMEQMARAGAEIFIIDAGWYCPPTKEMQWGSYAGDWYYDKERYPNGLKEVEAYCRSLGMGFGLWMEVERIGNLTQAYRDHQEWFTTRTDGSRAKGYIDLSNPQALAWVEEEAARVIEMYHLDLFRVDYNVESKELFHVGHKGGKRTCHSVEQVEGFYTLYNRLKRRFPHVIFENCAGGGGRTDLGMLRCFHHSWVSDCQVSPRSVLITNGMTMALPPDRVDRLVAGMGCHEFGSLDLHMRNAMLGHVSLNVFGPKEADMNPEVFAFISHSVDIYKKFIRPYLTEALIYHHTPDRNEIDQKGYVSIELAAPDKTRDTIAVFTMPGCGEKHISLCLKGIDKGKTYSVTFDNSGEKVVLTGYQLANGLDIYVSGALSSELCLIQAL